MADLTAVPRSFTIGETVQWSLTKTDYPASAGALVVTFINASHKFAVTATADGDSHLCTISAATSAGFTAGLYSWQAKYTATSDGAVTIIGTGTTEVVASFSAASTLDTRSHAKKVLEAIEAVIENRATEDHLSMSIAGRSIGKMSLAELIQARDLYRREYAEDRNAESLASDGINKRKIRTRYWV